MDSNQSVWLVPSSFPVRIAVQKSSETTNWIAETGDMLDARLRAGNVGTAEGALDVILDVVDRAQASLCEVAMLRIDAGFPSATLLAGLEARGIDYAVIKSGSDYRPFFEGAVPGGRTPLCNGRGGASATS